MISRTSLATICLVGIVAASLPVGMYSASNSANAATPSLAQEEDAYPKECLSTAGLENVSMNAYRQEATDLRTQSANVSSPGNGTATTEGLIEIESGYIDGNETCFDRISTENETMQIQLSGVEFENTSLRGPWTRIEFARGEAKSMTVVLPGDEFLNVLHQMHVGESFVSLFKDIYNLSSTDAGPPSGETGSDGPADGGNDSNENTTDDSDQNTTENGTDRDDESNGSELAVCRTGATARTPAMASVAIAAAAVDRRSTP